MWIFLKDAYLSIVADRDCSERLLVRARFGGDIERVFARAAVSETRNADYRYRASLPRPVVAEALAALATALTATNFKSSVADNWRHDLYLDVWGLMHDAQQRRAPR